LRTEINEEYLAIMENEFKKLGTNAGFKTSIIEKYIFMPPGLRIPYRTNSEVLLMSSFPFKTADGEISRYVIFDEKEEGREDTLRYRWLNEEAVQQMIAEAGIKIPQPESAPPLRVSEPSKLSWGEKVEIFGRYLLDKVKGGGSSGAQRAMDVELKWFSFGLASVVTGLIVVMFIRRRRKRG
jgi:hypothetical protein